MPFRDAAKVSNKALKRVAGIEDGARAEVYVGAKEAAHDVLGSVVRAAVFHMRHRRGERVRDADVSYALMRHDLPRSPLAAGGISPKQVKRVVRALVADAVAAESREDAQRFQLPAGASSARVPTVSQEALDLLHATYELVVARYAKWAHALRDHARRMLTNSADAALAIAIVRDRYVRAAS